MTTIGADGRPTAFPEDRTLGERARTLNDEQSRVRVAIADWQGVRNELTGTEGT